MNQLAPINPVNALATSLSADPHSLEMTLRQSIFKRATEAEFQALCIVSNAYGLNPFTKEIYAFPAKGGGIVPVVSIDGWLRIINSNSNFDGMQVQHNPQEGSCTVTIYRKDRAHPTVVTEYHQECFRPTDPWKTAPMRMLRHKAIMQCARVAFGLGGIFDDDAKDDPNHVDQERMRNVTPDKPSHNPLQAVKVQPHNVTSPANDLIEPPHDVIDMPASNLQILKAQLNASKANGHPKANGKALIEWLSKYLQINIAPPLEGMEWELLADNLTQNYAQQFDSVFGTQLSQQTPTEQQAPTATQAPESQPEEEYYDV